MTSNLGFMMSKNPYFKNFVGMTCVKILGVLFSYIHTHTHTDIYTTKKEQNNDEIRRRNRILMPIAMDSGEKQCSKCEQKWQWKIRPEHCSQSSATEIPSLKEKGK